MGPPMFCPPQPLSKDSFARVLIESGKEISMAAIQEAALQGEWFYLVERELLDRDNPEFFILRDGKVQSSINPELVGEYAITGDGAVLTFAPRARSTRTIGLCSIGAVFDETIGTLQADATYEMEALDEPTRFYGTFVRRDVY